MEVVPNSYMPGDPRLVEQLVYELKSQGIFDQFRKECIADVDTKPAYQNLRQRVEGSVTSFLKEQTWRPDMNKNQVREQVRKNIYESGYLETGVERIVDQVVNPKINTIFLPQVEDVVYRYLGIEKPNRYDVKKELKIDVTDLLPTDLEAISPESDHTKDDSFNFNDSINSESKMEEDESPPFEPIDVQNSNIQPEENSMDSHLSGFSGLQSHDSNPCMESKISQMELSNQDSQVSQNSSESRLSIITSEDNTKMDIQEDSNSKLLKSSDSSSQMEICLPKNPISVDPNSIEVDEEVKAICEAELSNDNNVVDENIVKVHNEEKPEDKMIDCIKNKQIDDKQNEDKKSNEKKDIDDKQSEDKKSNEKKDIDDKQNEDKKSNEKKSIDKKYKSSDKYNSKDRRDDKHRKSSSNSSSKEKERSSSKYSSSSSSKDKDKSKEKKESRSSSNSSNNKDRNDKEDYKNDKDRDKIKSDKDKEKSEKDKDKKERDKTDKSKSVKEKDKSVKDKDKVKSSSSSSSSNVGKNSTNKEKDKNGSNVKSDSSKKDKEKSRLSSSSTSKECKSKSSDSKSKSSSSDKYKKDDKSTYNNKHSSSSSSSSKRDKDKKKVSKKDKDDHYSSKDKRNNRRSTDRDSNDGRSGRQSQINSLSDSNSSQVQKGNQESSNSNSRSGSGDSGTSDQSEHTVKSPIKIIEQTDNKEILTSYIDTQKFKYMKPKFASNFQEARKLMKIRKQLAKLERHNQLSLAQIEVATEIPIVNGINCLKQDNSKTEVVENNKKEDNRKQVDDNNRKQVEDKNKKQVEDNNKKQVEDNNKKQVEDNNKKQVEDNNKKQVEDNNKKQVEDNNKKQVEDNNKKEVQDSSTKEVEDNKRTEIEDSNTTKTADNNDDEESVDELKEDCPTKIKTLEISECKMSPKDDTLLLQSKELSRENWEALEARLAQEMSNINYDSYESPYDDDYGECKSMSLIKTKINENCIVEEKVKEVIGSDSNKTEKNEHTDRVENNITEEREKTNSYDILSKDNQRNSTEQNEHYEKDVTEIELVNKDESDTATKMESEHEIAVDKDDAQIIIENNDKANHEENTQNSDSDSCEPCFYLKPLSPRLNRNLQFLNKYIDKLEKDVEHSLKTFQNNFVPAKQRYRKRKLVENVDFKNNNKAHYEQTTDMKKKRRSVAPNPNSIISKANKEKLCNSSDISPNDSFSLPLSPAESDKSNDKKEEESPKAKLKREKVGRGISTRSQRYSSEDLYKPRPIFMSSRRSRGAKTIDK